MAKKPATFFTWASMTDDQRESVIVFALAINPSFDYGKFVGRMMLIGIKGKAKKLFERTAKKGFTDKQFRTLYRLGLNKEM